MSGVCVPPWRDENVDDPGELIDCAVHLAALADDLHRGFVDLQRSPDTVLVRLGGVGWQSCEELDDR